MSSLAYVIAFLNCAANGSACDIVAVRAQIFANEIECRTALPTAVQQANRAHPSARSLKVVCRSLDEMCAVRRFGGQVSRGGEPVVRRLIQTISMRELPPSAELPLSLLCPKPQDDGDCLGGN